MDKIDVPVDALFFSEVNKRNTNPDGKIKDPALIERMDNDICKKCHEQYRVKYPNQPFKIICNGIPGMGDFEAMYNQQLEIYPDEVPYSIDEIREVYDIVFWAEKHIVVKNSDGDLVPFRARPYQRESLLCTANHIVDRWGRGLGKTTTAIIKELHKAITRKNLDIMVVCPYDSQSEVWYTEILSQVESSPTLRNCVRNKKQQPFKVFHFWNGSKISIFTAGSASGRGANTIRSQSPKRTRLEEQDYLVEKDWEAIDPIINRYPDSEFHGASTPTGSRQKFWEMCTQFPRFKEFYFPISVHPDWGPEKEETCIREAKTMDRYRHEYLAEFGDPTAGVFKRMFVDQARKQYYYIDCKYDPTLHYFMGVDWNAEGTGTKIRVVSYDKETNVVKCVYQESVDRAKFTQLASIQVIKDVNRAWHCDSIYIDAGFGQVQDELIRLEGYKAEKRGDDPDSVKLKDIVAIDFGANIKTNRLIPKRDNRYADGVDELERPTKPFIIEGAVMRLEAGLFEFSDEDDKLLYEQFLAYRVKNYSRHGYPSSYFVDGDCGDHDLTALVLAFLAVEMKYGLFRTDTQIRRIATFAHSEGFGMGTASMMLGVQSETTPDLRELKKQVSGVPARTKETVNKAYRLQYLMEKGAIVVPNRADPGGPGKSSGLPNSRTDVFRNRGRTTWTSGFLGGGKHRHG